jgi:hypothetical protein
MNFRNKWNIVNFVSVRQSCTAWQCNGGRVLDPLYFSTWSPTATWPTVFHQPDVCLFYYRFSYWPILIICNMEISVHIARFILQWVRISHRVELFHLTPSINTYFYLKHSQFILCITLLKLFQHFDMHCSRKLQSEYEHGEYNLC